MARQRPRSPSDPENTSPPRLTDVAALAGVSLTTASHCFSGKRYVAHSTKERVWRAAAELGFKTDHTPRCLAVLMRPPESLRATDFGTTSFSNLAGAIALSAMSHGYNAITARRIDDVAGTVARLDGCIIITPNHRDEVLQQALDLGLPVVSYDRDPGNDSFEWWVGPAYERSMMRLQHHMWERGARRIAVIIGGTDNSYRRAIMAAYTSFLKTVSGTPIVRLVDNSLGQVGAREATARLLGIHSPPDAIITTSSIFAAGVLDAARDQSVSVPETLMIATMTDGPLAELASIPITGLRIDTQQTAQAVITLFEQQLRGAVHGGPNEVDMQLIRRISTN